MKTFPLKSISLEEAKNKQFKLVECIMREFKGGESLQRGDVGLTKNTAAKVERVIADFFDAEACILVTGAGTGAIRFALMASIKPGQTLLVHDAPIYPTTKVTLDSMGVKIVVADFNNLEDIKQVFRKHKIDAALVQYTRQKPDDSYDMGQVISCINKLADIPVITDDNYAVMKVDKIGCELGTATSAFSSFKLQGPEGVGVVVGSKNIIESIEAMNYSGGSKIQGWQAMEVLRGLIYAPVMLAIQAEENEKCLRLLKELPQVKNAFLANAQSKVLLVEFNKPIAKQVIKKASELGALPNPVGAESKYEIAPMFYKVSGTFLKYDPRLIDTMIRINPNRASAKIIVDVLKKCF